VKSIIAAVERRFTPAYNNVTGSQEIHGYETKSRHRILTAFLNKVILSIMLLSLGLGLTAAGSAPAGADDTELIARGYVTNSLTARVVLKGDEILGGHGIEVLYPLQGPTDSSGYLPFQYQCTAAGCFQCMEFILWLYDTRLGYPTNGRARSGVLMS
jgi:hypothetical protein